MSTEHVLVQYVFSINSVTLKMESRIYWIKMKKINNLVAHQSQSIIKNTTIIKYQKVATIIAA